MSDEMLEFPCPACGAPQRLRERDVPLGGELSCPVCGEGITFAAPGRPVRSARRPSADDGTPAATRFSIADTLIRIEEFEDGSPAEPVAPDAPSAAAPSDDAASTEPRVVECPQCGHHFDPSGAGQGRPLVLIVEDTDFFLQLATDVLAPSYETIGVKTTDEARQILATRPVSLVLLDLTLEGAEGSDVLRAMPRQGIPVLIYTSRDETAFLGDEWKALRELGATDVIHKGLNIEERLLRKVDELLVETPARG